jgi:hypothetical protein
VLSTTCLIAAVADPATVPDRPGACPWRATWRPLAWRSGDLSFSLIPIHVGQSYDVISGQHQGKIVNNSDKEDRKDESMVERDELLVFVGQIVSAHVQSNTIPPDQLPRLIQDVYTALSTAAQLAALGPKPMPAVPVKSSVVGSQCVKKEGSSSMLCVR